jgi:hypothetical protein
MAARTAGLGRVDRSEGQGAPELALQVSDQFHVGRVAAPSVSARVPYLQPTANRLTNSQLESDAARLLVPEFTVPASGHGASPEPACRGLVDLGPESLGKRPHGVTPVSTTFRDQHHEQIQKALVKPGATGLSPIRRGATSVSIGRWH